MVKMTVRVEEGSNAALNEVATNIRASDVEEFLAINFIDTRADLIGLLLARYTGRRDTYAAFDGDRAVAFGAMVEARPNVITCGFFATDHFQPVAGRVARFIRKSLFPAYWDAGVHRIECTALARHGEARRFIELLGMHQEAVLQRYGKDGEDFHQFAWVL
jgi:hypothetical protein